MKISHKFNQKQAESLKFLRCFAGKYGLKNVNFDLNLMEKFKFFRCLLAENTGKIVNFN